MEYSRLYHTANEYQVPPKSLAGESSSLIDSFEMKKFLLIIVIGLIMVSLARESRARMIQCPTKLDYIFNLEPQPEGQWKSQKIEKKTWVGIGETLSATVEKKHLVCAYQIENTIVKLTQAIPEGYRCQVENTGNIKAFVCF